MSIVAYYTREEWYADGWEGVEPYVDGVCLLFREEDDPEGDILPVIVRIDPETRLPWPEDDVELPDVPYRYYSRDDQDSRRWIFEDEGADKRCHSRVMMARMYQQMRTG